jgi:hypothetical protein
VVLASPCGAQPDTRTREDLLEISTTTLVRSCAHEVYITRPVGRGRPEPLGRSKGTPSCGHLNALFLRERQVLLRAPILPRIVLLRIGRPQARRTLGSLRSGRSRRTPRLGRPFCQPPRQARGSHSEHSTRPCLPRVSPRPCLTKRGRISGRVVPPPELSCTCWWLAWRREAEDRRQRGK